MMSVIHFAAGPGWDPHSGRQKNNHALATSMYMVSVLSVSCVTSPSCEHASQVNDHRSPITRHRSFITDHKSPTISYHTSQI